MNASPLRLVAAAAAALSLLSATASAQSYTNLDIGPTNQNVASGFLAVGTSFGAGTNATNFPTTTFTSLTGDQFTLEITNLDQFGATVGGLDWRDRGDSTNTDNLTRVGEDFVKNNGGVIRLTLGSIPLGLYSVRSFHIDPDNSQSDRIQVFVSDATQTFALQPTQGTSGNTAGTSPGGVNNLNDAAVNASAANFSFTSNGTDPIVIVFDGRNSPNLDVSATEWADHLSGA
jgi:hypothetical protein